MTRDGTTEFGTGTTPVRLGAATVLVVALGALVFAGAAAAAVTSLLEPDGPTCHDVVCIEQPVLVDGRTRPVHERWTSASGVSLAYESRYWRVRSSGDSTLLLEFEDGGSASVSAFRSSSAVPAQRSRVAALRSEHPDLERQGAARVILGASVAGAPAISESFCATVDSSLQDVGTRVDIVLLTAVRRGLGVRVEVTSDGCGADAYTSPLFQHADSVVNQIRWPLRGSSDPAPSVAGVLEPADLARTYDFEPLWKRGMRGQGQTIAVVTWAPIPRSDLGRFDREFGIDGPPIESRGDAREEQELEFGSLEANLDLQVVRAVAPEARILAYRSGPLMGDLVAAVERVIADGEADVLSISGGICDVPVFPSGRVALRETVRTAGERVLARAAEGGVTVFVSSGDTGAYACQQGERDDHRVSTKWPAGSPSVVAVGGTLVRGNPGTNSITESGWQDAISFAGSGGGASPVEPRPVWQRAAGLPSEPGRRLVPDVSAAASPDSAYAIVHDGEELAVGGTSGAAPLWAAVFSLVEQYVEQDGGREIGFAAPLLYDVARSRATSGALRDVVGGGNRLQRATVGWDSATGLGTPDAWRLATALAELRR